MSTTTESTRYKYDEDKEFNDLFRAMINYRKIRLIRAINHLKEDLLFIASYDEEKAKAYMKELDFLEEYDSALTVVSDFEYDDTDPRL